MQIYDRLDDIRMSAIDRENAKVQMRSAEATIDFVVAAVVKARAVTAEIGRRAVNLARRMQVSDQQAAQ